MTTLPRGGLHVVQPQRVAEAFVKAYTREFQQHDAASWKAIETGGPARAETATPYVNDFLTSFGYAFAASAPIQHAVFDGYAGAVQVLRTTEQGAFTDAELRKLNTLVQELERQHAGGRGQRHGDAIGDEVWHSRPSQREWLFDTAGRVRLFASAFAELDEQLQEQIVDQVRQRVKNIADETPTTARVLLADTTGDQWAFNFVIFPKYPALGSGPVAFVSLQPTFPEWVALRPTDFQADPELARLLPALKFMQQDFHRGPTLTEIAKTVHLSPFHFHRRFSELLGLTPKHFLLECQIHDAKKELLAGNKELAKIAADCGFAHQSHFTSRFKQATGLTPTRWRRMARQRSTK